MSDASPDFGARDPEGIDSRRRWPWPRWFALSGAVLVLGLLLLNAWPIVQRMLGIAPTLGTIYVDSPEVYTRERLVNDRFRQEAWLVQQLGRTNKLMDEGRFDGIEGRRISNVTRVLNAAANLSTPQTSSGQNTIAEELISTAKEATRSDQNLLSAAPIDSFQDAQTYRDVIRTELMSSQLDDRHDIEGNTLYRLNFDAAIAPGENTTAAALVEVILEEGVPSYNDVYDDWHRHLQTEIESAINAQTLDLLQSGQSLRELDKLALRELIERKICEALHEIVDLLDQPDEKNGVDTASQQNMDFICYKMERYVVETAIGKYISAYMRSLKERNGHRYVQEVDGLIEVSQPDTVLPKELCEVVLAPPNSSISCVRDSDAIDRAVLFAEAQEGCKLADADGESGALETTRYFSVSDALQLPCPKKLRPHEPLLGAITMLERLRRARSEPFLPGSGALSRQAALDQIICRISPKLSPSQGAPAQRESCGVSDNASSSGANSSLDSLLSGQPVPELRPSFVRRVVAEMVQAKLDNQLRSVRVASPIGGFFDPMIRGCEFEACSLVLMPLDGEVDAKLKDKLNEKATTFSYAVTPTGMVQRIASEDATRMNLQAALRAAAGTNGADFDTVLQSLYQFDDRIEVRHRNPIVVGFGSPYHANASSAEDPLRTIFGWVVRPRLVPNTKGQDQSILQVAQHYPLSAVVSVPSWWRSLKLTVRTRWIDNDGDWAKLGKTRDADKCGTKEHDPPFQTCRTHDIQVPGSVKEINHKLKYEVRAEPYIDSNAEPTRHEQVLEIGQSGQIILQGGRLWRSTVVTVGQQRADSIVVLPDMNGVVAEFLCVQPPPGYTSGEGDSIQLVTVWTSEGSTRTPVRVRLRPFVEKAGERKGPCFPEDRSSP